MLAGNKVLLGVTGSIAAYKAAQIVRLLIRKKVQVRVIMTDSAKDFITPLTLSTLSKNPVNHLPFDPGSGEWFSHVDLGNWADVFLIAPATANTMAKMANGICDNLLLATYLSANCQVVIAPAMDLNMYKHPATQNNISILKERGNFIIDPIMGELASGLIGEGKMAEPEDIVAEISRFFK